MENPYSTLGILGWMSQSVYAAQARQNQMYQPHLGRSLRDLEIEHALFYYRNKDRFEALNRELTQRRIESDKERIIDAVTKIINWISRTNRELNFFLNL